jgi:hypothetical protein
MFPSHPFSEELPAEMEDVKINYQGQWSPHCSSADNRSDSTWRTATIDKSFSSWKNCWKDHPSLASAEYPHKVFVTRLSSSSDKHSIPCELSFTSSIIPADIFTYGDFRSFESVDSEWQKIEYKYEIRQKLNCDWRGILLGAQLVDVNSLHGDMASLYSFVTISKGHISPYGQNSCEVNMLLVKRLDDKHEAKVAVGKFNKPFWESYARKRRRVTLV